MNNIIFDGAFGTYILSKYNYQDPPETASLRDPKLVEKIHTEYLRAGANAIKTNTFALNPTTVPDADELHKLIYAAASCAVNAVEGVVNSAAISENGAKKLAENGAAISANAAENNDSGIAKSDFFESAHDISQTDISRSGVSQYGALLRSLPVRIFADIGPAAPSMTQPALPVKAADSATAANENSSANSTANIADTAPSTAAAAVIPRTRAYLETAEIFIDLGFKDFIFETQTDAKPLREAVSEIKRRVSDSFVIVSFAVGQDGYSESGQYYLSLFEEAAGYGADAVGLNCVCGPAHTLSLLSEAVSSTKNSNTNSSNTQNSQSGSRFSNGGCALCAMPNAGYPSFSNGRTIYIDNPGYFAEKINAIHSLGVEILGGCCGTEPEHIRRVAALLADKNAEKTSTASDFPRIIAETARAVSDISRTTDEAARDTENRPLPRGFDKPFIAVELPAPTDTETDFLLAASTEAKAAGADFVTIPDSPLGKSRANSVMTASLVRRKIGIDVIPHMTCRDRNRIAIKGDLISGNIDGITHLLAITGDSIAESERRTDSASPKNVFNLNSFKLIEFVKELNGIIFGASPYTVCAALNITAQNFDEELARAEKKICFGADCFFTQPIFSEATLKNYLTAKKRFGRDAKIAPGIMLLGGYKNAVFLKNEVPGIDIPNEIIDRLQLLCNDPDKTRELCIEYGCEIARKIAENGIPDGFYIMTPLKKIDYSAALVRYIKKEIMPE